MNNDLISRSALMDAMGHRQGCECSCADCEKINCFMGEVIEAAPAVEAEPVTHCKDCEKSRKWGNEGTLLCYRDETTVHIVKPDAYCDGSQRRYAADDPDVLKFEPVVHAHWIPGKAIETKYGTLVVSVCSNCNYLVSHNGFICPYKRCPECGAHMDENLEIRTCYCPICDKHFEIRSNDSMGSCPDCGHHVVLWREGEE